MTEHVWADWAAGIPLMLMWELFVGRKAMLIWQACKWVAQL